MLSIASCCTRCYRRSPTSCLLLPSKTPRSVIMLPHQAHEDACRKYEACHRSADSEVGITRARPLSLPSAPIVTACVIPRLECSLGLVVAMSLRGRTLGLQPILGSQELVACRTYRCMMQERRGLAAEIYRHWFQHLVRTHFTIDVKTTRHHLCRAVEPS